MNYREKCRWLADFYREAAETGRVMQTNHNGQWVNPRIGPNLNSTVSDWRLKPEPPKAWVVWDDKYARGLFVEPDEAERVRKLINGTIQEITRPDIAKAEGRQS
jgi:hypothetical protein